MAKQKTIWKKGRGKLGILSPLMGSWIAEAASPMGNLTCTQIFEPILNSNYIQLTATWDFTKFSYEEHAIIGIRDGTLSFWSFNSDGKNSQGTIAHGKDIHPEAICIEAQCQPG